jgi:hypothetical protein
MKNFSNKSTQRFDGYVVSVGGQLSPLLDNESDIQKYLSEISITDDDILDIYRLVPSEYEIQFEPVLKKTK